MTGQSIGVTTYGHSPSYVGCRRRGTLSRLEDDPRPARNGGNPGPAATLRRGTAPPVFPPLSVVRPIGIRYRSRVDEPGEPRSQGGPLETTIGRLAPNSVDGHLVQHRLMAKMFGREIPAPRFGRFELRDRIGHGGMGVVYEAWDPQLERAVAIKVVDTVELGEAARERALREARSLAKLAHPNVITVHEAGLVEQQVWIAMELVEGSTVQQWLQRRPRPSDSTILAHWIAVGRGLLAAHRAGLIHRDVKPSNVLIGDDGRARLIDFGLHGELEGSSESERTHVRGTSEEAGEGSTVAGFVGTYRYAAPEQRSGGPVDAAADQYALCACIWESLAGQMPPDLPEGTSMSRALQEVLRRGLSTMPAARFPSLAQLLSAIERATAAPPGGRKRWVAAAGLVAVLAGVGTAQWLDSSDIRPDPCVGDASALDGAWDETRRATLRDRFAKPGQAFAPTTFATLERGIDAWAVAWHDAQRSACEATRVHGSDTESALVLRRACLEHQRRSLRVTLDTWSTAQEAPALPAHGAALLRRLPVVSDCADATHLAEVEPLPASDSARPAVLAGYDRLNEARALAGVGATDQAEAIVTELETRSPEAMAYAPLRLELQALPLQMDVERGLIFRAVPGLVELSREAEARHLDVLAAQLRVEAAVAAAGRWSGAQPERFVVEEAETALRRLARSPEPLRAALMHARAALLLQEGQYEDALTGFRRAQAEARATGDEAQGERERWFIASTLGQLGHYDEARAELEAGRAAAELRWGSTAPLVGSFEFDLAVLALETGDFEGAERHLDRAKDIDEAAFGTASLAVARGRFARAKVRMAQGELAAALGLVDQAFVVYLRELGPDHEKLAELHEARGVLRFFNEDVPGSIESYRAALTIARATVGAAHPSLARLHSNLGESQAALGRLEQARESFAQALEIYERTLPADHPELALPLKGRGQVALASGRSAEAVEDLERALQLQVATGAEPLEIADIRFSLAQALVASEGSRSAHAEALAEQARDGFDRLQLSERARAVETWLRR